MVNPQLRLNSELLSIKETHLTPTEVVEAARELMDGVIDLDPCTNFEINTRHVKANSIFDLTTNGLENNWFGNVLCNPPGKSLKRGDMEVEYIKHNNVGCKSGPIAWWHKLRVEHHQGRVKQGLYIVFNPKQLSYSDDMWDFPICFTSHSATAECITTSGRMKYLDLTDDGLVEQGQPTNNGALIYLPPKVETPMYVERFYKLFRQFGKVGRLVG